MESGSSATFFGVAKASTGDNAVRHDYSTIMRVKYTLFWPHFSVFSHVIVLELCQSYFHLLSRFSLNITFLFENVLKTGGGLNPGYANRSNASFYIAFGDVQMFPLLILSLLAWQVNQVYRLKIDFLCDLLCK